MHTIPNGSQQSFLFEQKPYYHLAACTFPTQIMTAEVENPYIYFVFDALLSTAVVLAMNITQKVSSVVTATASDTLAVEQAMPTVRFLP